MQFEGVGRALEWPDRGSADEYYQLSLAVTEFAPSYNAHSAVETYDSWVNGRSM